jgi:hypothetical protein
VSSETARGDGDEEERDPTPRDLEIQALFLYYDALEVFDHPNSPWRVICSALMGTVAVIAGTFRYEDWPGRLKIESTATETGPPTLQIMMSYQKHKRYVKLVAGRFDFDEDDEEAVQKLSARCELIRRVLLLTVFSETESRLAADAITTAYKRESDQDKDPPEDLAA